VDHARQSARGHARDVPSPLEKSVVVVAVNGVEVKALVKGFGFDVVRACVTNSPPPVSFSNICRKYEVTKIPRKKCGLFFSPQAQAA
jgi:hypothetical protein